MQSNILSLMQLFQDKVECFQLFLGERSKPNNPTSFIAKGMVIK
jgi:hypothetical protein